MSYFETSTSSVPSEAMKDYSNVSSNVRAHLAKVYGTLALTCLTAAAGAYLHVNDMVIYGGGLLSFLVGLGCLIGILSLSPTPENNNVRFGLLWVFAFMEGLSLGPLLKIAFAINGSGEMVYFAALCTAGIFAAFTLSAVLCERRSYLYLGGLLGSVLNLLLWSQVFNMFFRSKLLWSIELYTGLFMFCGYILYDTQAIIYRAACGYTDVVGHTVDLFIDLVGVFVRILVILMQKEEDNKDRKRKEKRQNNYAAF
ncbi:5511_t:CDS:2 [Paraglomus occultum]|uniref:5511_t:CDS:1 n=1 Tax=Paraglomus occultum TaxID=144539 RepID=A0A9N9A7R1_9GLOM|nr:5511_t:CDS:2 [Paraglomus occultum]